MKYISILLLFCFYGCGETECCINVLSNCYSFDIRQCQTDVFSVEVLETGSIASRESAMKKYLVDAGLEIDKVKLVENFHDIVCEACDICPQADRYFVRLIVKDKNEGIVENLRLLNYEATDCAIFN